MQSARHGQRGYLLFTWIDCFVMVAKQLNQSGSHSETVLNLSLFFAVSCVCVVVIGVG